MKRRSEPPDSWEERRARVIGLGDRSLQKSYYPELQQRLTELERFRTLLDYSRDAVLLIQLPSGRLVDINESACRQLGYGREQLLAGAVQRLVVGLGAEVLEQVLSESELTEGHETILDLELECQSGARLPVEMTLRKVRLSDALYAVAVARDVTERRRAQAALLQSEYKYRNLFDRAYDAIVVLDEHRCIDCNPKALELFHCSREQFVGLTPLDVSPELQPDGRPSTLAVDALISAAMSGYAQSFEWKYRRLDGSQFDAEVHLSRIEWAGEPCLQAVVRDITERKLADEQEHSNRLVAEAVAAASVNYLQTRSVSAMAQTIVDAAVRIAHCQFGLFVDWAPVQPPTARLLALSHPTDALESQYAGWRAMMMEIREKGSTELPEGLRNTKAALNQGQLTVINDPKKLGPFPPSFPPVETFLAVPLRMGDELVGLLALANRPGGFTDTEVQRIQHFASTAALAVRLARSEESRAHAEDQLRHAQRLESVGRLAGGVAHDFNNLLTVITGYSDLLLASLHSSDPMHEDLQQIQKAAQQASALTRQLLAFSRKQLLELKALRLNEVVLQLEKMLRRLIREDIDLSVLLEPDLGTVKADPTQLEQIIVNLVVNARDSMPKGGKLTLRTANVELDQEYTRLHPSLEPGYYARLSVTDTGTGMPREMLAHIFEPFFTTKEPGKGTGLGLSMVYGIVKQHGGHVDVYSELGVGTSFHVYLPQTQESSQAHRPMPVSPQRLRGHETVLVVEDEQMVRRLACRYLSNHGYQVLEARQGGEALLICERHPGRIDLLLTDVVMPTLGGAELASRLRAFHPEMKVCFMSGYPDNALGQDGILGEAVQFLSKPFTQNGLLSKVRDILGWEASD